MKNLTYQVACKSCLQTDGVSRLTMIKDSFEEFYEGRRLKSEYQLSQIIIDFLKSSKQPCQFCGSYNLEINEIEFDGKQALVGQDVDQLQLVISKNQNGKIDIRTGGSQYLPKGFLKESIEIMEKAIEKAHDSEFTDKQIGNARFVVSTGFIGSDDYRTNRLEQFSFVGFSKKDLRDMVGHIKSQMVK